MPNKMERFTDGARIVINKSQEATEEFKHGIITPEHLLLAMTRTPKMEVYHILNEFDVIEAKLLPYLRGMFRNIDLPSLDGMPELSNQYKKVLELSVDEARRYGHYQIGSLHLLLGIIRLDSPTIREIFAHFDVDSKVLRENIFPDEAIGCLDGLRQVLRGKSGKKKNDE